MKLAHLTSAHPRYDTRIYYKMCSSLAKKDYEVYLIVADGKGDEQVNKISILDIGKSKGGRFQRMTKTVKSIFKKAKELEADIYHLHDPELIPIGLKLLRLGKKVIFDAHEDLPKQILNKEYIPKAFRLIVSKIFEYYETWALSKFNFVTTATPNIRNKFLRINSNTIDINNFPIVNKSLNKKIKKKNEVIYLGLISKIRGVEEMILALKYTKKIKLNLVGNYDRDNLKKEIKQNLLWKKVNEFGFLNRKNSDKILKNSIAGLVVFLPEPNHVSAQPNKLFEYMNAGLPVIASNFPLWREVIEGNNCGICVDPNNPRAIGNAIQYLFENKNQAKQMGKNGLEAIKKKYNWRTEEKKLLKLYTNI